MSFEEFGERLTGKFAIPDGEAQLYERGATMRKGGHMRRKLMWVLVVGGVAVGAASYVTTVLATPASGFTSTSLAVGRLGEFDVMHKLVWDDPDPTNSKKNVWHSTQKTKGDSDLYVQSNVWVPCGTSGWHTHPGHSLITVTAGTVTTFMKGTI